MHWFFRLLLLAYPRRFRRVHSAEMWLTFERHLRDAETTDRMAVAKLWAREIIWSARNGWRTRLSNDRHRPRIHGGDHFPYRSKRVALGFSWLDFKLGFRMLVRYPGLTFVGGLAIAFAIWVGAGTFEFISQWLYPTLPLPDGDRIVAIRVWDRAAARPDHRIAFDFAEWREHLQSVRDLGAYRVRQQNLLVGDGIGEPVDVAEISASAFQVAAVAPLIGRSLVPGDDVLSAPGVVVLGHDVWQARFAADTNVVGRMVRLGNDEATVVGVMPVGFAFPVSQNLWTPLKLEWSRYEAGQGPAIHVFGRLSDGASFDEAQAELAALGRRVGADHPQTHEHLRPQLMPHAAAFVNLSSTESVVGLMSTNLFIVMLLFMVCGNVALLMFARAASRQNEIAVRSALGASRRRIVTQLFVEALVLAGVGMAVGLVAARAGLRWGLAKLTGMGGDLPFWISDRLSPSTILYVVGLTGFGALIAGVVPGLKATALQRRLQGATAGGGGLQFGGLWTLVIVVQIAITVTFPASGFFLRLDARRMESTDVGFSTDEYLTARLDVDRQIAPAATDTSQSALVAQVQSLAQEFKDRLLTDPTVTGVTFADRFPLMYHPHRLIEVDAGGAAPLVPPWPGYRISSASVDIDFFDVLDTPISFGRGFHPGDLGTDPGPVIVNESFVDRVLGGRNPIGRRVRYTYFEEHGEPLEEPSAWYEIVGVVRDLGMARQGMAIESDPKVAGVYHPVRPGTASPLRVAVHVRGDPNAFVPTLRTTATGVDPTLRLHDVMPLRETIASDREFYAFWFWLVVLASGVAMVLSLAGIYSVMAFTVARRTKEIGIRVALGSNARRIALAIFRRPLTQVAVGVLIGSMLTTALSYSILRGTLWPNGIAVIVVYAAVMMGVCLLACIVPTRRALRIQPTDALREDG